MYEEIKKLFQTKIQRRILKITFIGRKSQKF